MPVETCNSTIANLPGRSGRTMGYKKRNNLGTGEHVTPSFLTEKLENFSQNSTFTLTGKSRLTSQFLSQQFRHYGARRDV